MNSKLWITLPSLLLATACGASSGTVSPEGTGTSRQADTASAAEALCNHLQGTSVGPVKNLAALEQIVIGTFDATSGVFTWDPAVLHTDHTKCHPVCLPHIKPCSRVCDTVREYYITPTAIDLDVTIRLVNNATQAVTLEMGNDGGAGVGASPKTAYANAGASVITLRGDFGGKQSFYVSGAAGTLNSISFPRSEFLTAGCITIPALPVGIVYQPPSPTATSQMALVDSLGARFTHVAGTDLLGNADDPGIDSAAAAAQALKLAADELASTGIGDANIYGQIAQFFLQFISDALQPGGAQQTTSVEVDHTHALDFVTSTTNAYFSDPASGPGDGDVIVYAPNVRVAYYNHNGRVTFVPLAYEGLAPVPVFAKDLMPGAANPPNLPEDVRASLLALDPMATHHHEQLHDNTARFSYVGQLKRTETTHEIYAQSYSVTDTTTAQQSFDTRTTDGLEIMTTLGDASGVSSEHTVSASLEFTGPIDINIYYDHLFGSFVYNQVPARRP